MPDDLRQELLKRQVKLMPSHNQGKATSIKADPSPVQGKISSMLESVRQQPVSRILDLIGMSPVTHAQQLVQGADPLSTLGADIQGAGMPYAAIMQKLGKGKGTVYHGTPRKFHTFDPTRNDSRDTLGWMTHFAEEPGYANQWASGRMKNFYDHVNFDSTAPFDPAELGYNTQHNVYSNNKLIKDTLGPQVIPARLDAQNVLDMDAPTNDDTVAMLAALPNSRRREILDYFKRTRRDNREGLGWGEADPTHYIAGLMQTDLKDPRIFGKTSFDAVRYNDAGEPSVAVPDLRKLTTPWGTPLSVTPQTKPVSFAFDPSGLPVDVRPSPLPKLIDPKQAPKPYPSVMKTSDIMKAPPSNWKPVPPKIPKPLAFNPTVMIDGKPYRKYGTAGYEADPRNPSRAMIEAWHQKTYGVPVPPEDWNTTGLLQAYLDNTPTWR